jgi:GR25 family glycosyltransferase involved in LPS biosynthesis
MTIDKNIPIYVISISNNEISQFYRKITDESFLKRGYSNLIHHEATLSSTIPEPNYLNFSNKRVYSSKKERNWRDTEKAIWYSHTEGWKKVIESGIPGIIIEHDCVLIRKIPKSITKFPLFSFACSTRNHSLAAVGYYIKPERASTMLNEVLNQEIKLPVDGFIHSKEPWYPYGILEKEWIKNNIFARHFINSKIGTNKERIGARN